MSKYRGTYSCGHDGVVDIGGKTDLRQRKADRYFEKLCPDCWAKQMENKKEEYYLNALELAKEMDLPELKGTEKQVKWAVTLRQQLIDMFEKNSIKEDYADHFNIEINIIDEIIDYIILANDKASFYIDNRGFGFNTFGSMLKAFNKSKENTNENLPWPTDSDLKKLKEESTIYPDNPISNIPADIKVYDDKVTAIFEKNEKFMDVVKKLGYTWKGIWERDILETTGSSIDRAAELANKLLQAGFAVCIMDADARQKAIDGTFQPEHRRWIRLRMKKDSCYYGWFVITWSDGTDLYKKAKKIPGSVYDSPHIVVRPESFAEVQDFAELYGLKFTKLAEEALQQAIAKREAARVVSPVKVDEPKPKDGLKEILNSGFDILEDLKDD